MLRDALRFVQNGVFRTRGDLFALMEIDRTETTSAKTAAMGGNAELYRLECGNAPLLVILRMPTTRKRQRVQGIQFLLGQRCGGWIDHHQPGALILYDRPAGWRGLGLIGKLEVHELCVVGGQCFARWQFDGIVGDGRLFDDAVGRAGDVVQVVEHSAAVEPPGDIENGRFAHAMNEQIGLGVGEDGALEFVGDVVIMGQPPE